MRSIVFKNAFALVPAILFSPMNQANSVLSKIFSAASVRAARCRGSLCAFELCLEVLVLIDDIYHRYCLTQADTEAIAEYLMKSGIAAKACVLCIVSDSF